jgi:cytoskeletal protein CcmA (bactofilin family)
MFVLPIFMQDGMSMAHFRFQSHNKTGSPENSLDLGYASWLGAGLHVKGDITGTEDLCINGSVEGTIQLDEHTLTVGSAARLTGDVNARDVVIYGYLKGDVHATGRIEVKKISSVIGNLTTTQIVIEDEADFEGSIGTGAEEKKEAVEEKPPLRRAAAVGGRF